MPGSAGLLARTVSGCAAGAGPAARSHQAAADSRIGDKGYQDAGFITPFKKPQGGKLHDWQKEFNAQVNRLCAPVKRAIAHPKSWRILHTDYRRPLRTWRLIQTIL